MKLAFTLAASAFLATVPITASPIIPNTFPNTAIIKQDTAIVSPATVSDTIHPTTTTVSLRSEESKAADESDSDVDDEDKSDESDYFTSDSEDDGRQEYVYVSREDITAENYSGEHGDTLDDNVESHVNSFNRRGSHTAEYWKSRLPSTSHNRRGSHGVEYWKSRLPPTYWNQRPPASSPNRRTPMPEELSQDDKDKAISDFHSVTSPMVKRNYGDARDKYECPCMLNGKYKPQMVACADKYHCQDESKFVCISYKGVAVGFTVDEGVKPTKKASGKKRELGSTSTSTSINDDPKGEFIWGEDEEKPIKNSKRSLDNDLQRRTPGHRGIKCTKVNEFPYCDNTRNMTLATCHCAMYQWNDTTKSHNIVIIGPAEKDDSDAPKHKRDLPDSSKKRSSIDDINSFDSGSYGSYLPADIDDHNSMAVKNEKRYRVPLMSRHPGAKVARAEDYGYMCANTAAQMRCKNTNGVIECDCYPPMETAIQDEKSPSGWRCQKSKKTDVPVSCYSAVKTRVNQDCFCMPPAEKAIKKPNTKRDVSAGEVVEGRGLIPLSELSGRGLVARKLASQYYCTNPRAKIMCEGYKHAECWCFNEEWKVNENGTSMATMVKGDKAFVDSDSNSNDVGGKGGEGSGYNNKEDDKKPADKRDATSESDSDSVVSEPKFETKSKRDLLQFDIFVTLPGDVVKALTGSKKRDFPVKREMEEEEHLLEGSMLEGDVTSQEHEFIARKNNGYGTREVKCKETGDVAGFCLVSGYCYCLQCRGFPDNCDFVQRKGVGDSKRGLASPTENNLLEDRDFTSDRNTNPGQIPPYILRITSQVKKNNRPVTFTCQAANGGFCIEDGCYCVKCQIGLNGCSFKRLESRSAKRAAADGGGTGLDELLTIDDEAGEGEYYQKKSLVNEKEKRGGVSGVHRTSPFGRPVTVGRRSAMPLAMPMPDNQAILDKRGKGFDCPGESLGAFCFADDECFCLKCKKFPKDGCSFVQRKFFRNTKTKRDLDFGVTASSSLGEDGGTSKREVVDDADVVVVVPPTMTRTITPTSSVLSNTSVPLASSATATATFTANPDDVANRNHSRPGHGLKPEVNIFARGRRADGYKPQCVRENMTGQEGGNGGAGQTSVQAVDKLKLKARDQANNAGSACSPVGGWNCIDGKSYQQCTPGGIWTAAMPMAAGTTCTLGQTTMLNVTATAAGSKMRRLTSSVHVAREEPEVVAVPQKGDSMASRSLEEEKDGQEGQDEGTHRVAIPGAGEIDVEAE